MFTSMMLVEYVTKLFTAGAKYWYGTFGQVASSSLYSAKKAQYPSHYTAGRAATYQKQIEEKRTVVDCAGLIKSFFWSSAGAHSLKYKANNCPDVSANGMIKLCQDSGPMNTMPDVPGVVVWSNGHIGVYVGGGYVIEARGFSYGVVKSKVASRTWVRWGRLPQSMLQYVPNDEPGEAPEPVPDGDEVRVTPGSTVNVRAEPNAAAKILGVASAGEVFAYLGETTPEGWHRIRYEGAPGWISGKYTVLSTAEPKPPEDNPKEGKGLILDLSEKNSLKSPKNNWAKLASAVDFIILRCGVTRTYTKPLGIGVDNEFAYAAKKCIEHEIPFGVYYYGKVSMAQKAREEARKAFETASPFSPLFYVYDVEEARLTNEVVEAWMDEMRALGAQKVGLYVAHHMYAKFKKAIAKADFHWEPKYGKNTGAYDPAYDSKHGPDLHQYTSVKKVPALADQTVDANRIAGKKSLSWFLGLEE